MSGLDRSTWRKKNYYEILEVPTDASPEELRAAKTLLLCVWRAERFDRAEWKRVASERYQFIEEAYRCLADELMRIEYDATLIEKEALYEAPFGEGAQCDSRAWKRLAAWMKANGAGNPFLRKMAFTAGDYIERRRTPSPKQLPLMLKAWEEGLRAGFDPGAVD